MKEFKNILFPVDLSKTSAKMVPYVLLMANRFQSKIHILFVLREIDHFTEMYVSKDTVRNFYTDTIKGCEKSLYEFQEKHFNQFSNASSKVAIGDISEEIAKYIKSEKIDLMILGTHGRKGMDKIFFGSIAERLLKTAMIPIFLVNPYRSKLSVPIDATNLKIQKRPRILFAVDLSEISIKLVPFVELLAQKFQAEIHLITVVRPAGYFTAVYQEGHSLESFNDIIIDETKAKLNDFKNQNFNGFPDAKAHVDYGDIPEEIIDHINDKKIDFLVMGTHGRKGIDKILFGSVAERVAKTSPVPILLINPYRLNS
jgi:nucleotide-binding universal stress UspA family protein